ncbi:synaptic vesicular amine transporter-like isoform X2 [Varroa jacobsoni]|uniref:synaptic vesicular amine transporter-like isoform X2 n=1 Tax=Varroa jacobsoni TaxID=62625 RepID=UPI000BF99912|nr:synaptic vesicular amine transporter-like isoform X2 [Varroa jacobsoni]
MTVSGSQTTSGFQEILQRYRGDRKLVLVIVAVALLLDNMLLTSVVPIIPDFLYELHKRELLEENKTFFETTAFPVTTMTSTMSRENATDIPGPDLINTVTRTTTSGTIEIGSGSTLVPDQEPDRAESRRQKEREENLRHEMLKDENVEVGLLFASKPVVQALINPLVGEVTNRIGYTVPMFAGFVIMFLSTLVFAIGASYGTLFFARTLQGVGSACTSVAGMGMLADKFPDDRERGNAMAVAMGVGLALGVMIGPPYGGIMYEFVSRSAPFLVLAAVTLFDGLLQLAILQPSISQGNIEGASLSELLRDPYIVIAAGAITFANLGIAVLEPSLPLWLMDTMHTPKWQQGAVFLPASISYLIGTNLFGPLGHKLGRWLSTMVGLIIIGLSLLCIPMARNVNQLILPNAGIGFAIGMVDSSMMPMLGYLVDIRHTSVYGSVYAIGDAAFCVGFVLGPLVSSTVVKTLGFKALVYLTGIVCICYAPLLFVLRDPPTARDEGRSLVMGSTTLRYDTYTNEESPIEETKLSNMSNNQSKIQLQPQQQQFVH